LYSRALTSPTMIPGLLVPYEVITLPIDLGEIRSQKHDKHINVALNEQANRVFEFDCKTCRLAAALMQYCLLWPVAG